MRAGRGLPQSPSCWGSYASKKKEPLPDRRLCLKIAEPQVTLAGPQYELHASWLSPLSQRGLRMVANARLFLFASRFSGRRAACSPAKALTCVPVCASSAEGPADCACFILGRLQQICPLLSCKTPPAALASYILEDFPSSWKTSPADHGRLSLQICLLEKPRLQILHPFSWETPPTHCARFLLEDAACRFCSIGGRRQQILTFPWKTPPADFASLSWKTSSGGVFQDKGANSAGSLFQDVGGKICRRRRLQVAPPCILEAACRFCLL